LHAPTESGGQGVSQMTYNGVTMTVIQTKKILEESITLGQQVSGTRRTATVLATIHRTTAGPTVPGVPPVGPQAGAAFPDGAAAYVSIRNTLMQQRRGFNYTVGGVVIANFTPTIPNNLVPAPNTTPFEGDPELGPKPLACNLIAFYGTGTAMIEYTIQWATRACQEDDVQAVLAHVWKCDDDISETYFLTRTYQGRVIFDPRVVGGASGIGGIHPDRVRGLILPARAPGFVRKRVLIQSSEDMKTLDYTVIDEQPQQFVNSNLVPKIVAVHSIKNTNPSWVEKMKATGAMVTAPGGAMPDLEKGINPFKMSFDILNAGFTAAGAAYTAIPLAVHHVKVTAYGSPDASLHTMARIARVIALWRLMKGSQLGLPLGNLNASLGFGGAEYGGSCSQTDSSDPYSSTVEIEAITRPLVMQNAANQVPGLGDLINAAFGADPVRDFWNLGRNDQLRVTNGAPQQIQIFGIDGATPIPIPLQQLVFGGTIQGAPGAWGWLEPNGFAGDYLSNADKGIRGNYPNGVLGTGSPFALMLIQTLQDICENDTVPAKFNAVAPLTQWPDVFGNPAPGGN
jgi:hypothetical protein